MAVTPAQVATTLGRTPPVADSVPYDQWAMWIDDTRRIIENRLGSLDALDQEDLDYVVREAVAARVRNPDASTSSTVSVDDGSVTRRFERSTGQITILDAWWNLLTPDEDAQAFTIRPYAPRQRLC